MWKAVVGLIVGILVGIFLCNPLYAGKKKKPRVVEDTDRDGVVEFVLPLYKPGTWIHESCSDGFTHNVFYRVVEGPIGLPWLYMRWEVDEKATHMARLKKFGPGYWLPREPVPSHPRRIEDW